MEDGTRIWRRFLPQPALRVMRLKLWKGLPNSLFKIANEVEIEMGLSAKEEEKINKLDANCYRKSCTSNTKDTHKGTEQERSRILILKFNRWARGHFPQKSRKGIRRIVNTRNKVQEFTGIPAAPFNTSSSSFLSCRFDLYGSGIAPLHPLRPSETTTTSA
ncbi:hypothetical protein L1887_36532 [Cichorium endivia]|nr:hypothetical protein L1887_36532 [Cichorium endivia]